VFFSEHSVEVNLKTNKAKPRGGTIWESKTVPSHAEALLS